MRRVIVCVVALACLGGVASAEEQPKEPPAYPLKFDPAPGLPNGKVSLWKGMAKAAPGDRFFTENLLVLQPITVSVVAKNKGDKIHVTLTKMRWDDKHMEAETGAEQKVILRTRTQGDFRVTVTSPDGGEKPYYLIVWVGDEHKPQLKSVITPMKDYKGQGAKAAGGSGSKTGIIIAVVLGLGILILIVKLWKRGMK